MEVCVVSNLSKQQSVFQLPQMKFLSVVSFLIFSFQFSSISTRGNDPLANLTRRLLMREKIYRVQY